MLEVKYYRDYRHNYMILQCGHEENARSYQYKILTSGKIGEILRCTVRHVNGTTYYYYDISSRTTLESLYKGKKMSYAQLKDVLWQLHGICDRLSGYFMEEAGLVLLPEHIYYDMSHKKYIGLYYPDYQTMGPDAFRPLMDFLLEHIDTEDHQLTEDMYRIYEMAEEPHFCIEDAIRILEDREEYIQEVVYEQMHDSEREPEWGMNQEPVMMKPLNFEEMEEPEREKRHVRTSPKRNWFYPVFALLFILGITGAVVVYNMYELTQEEELTLYGVMAVMGVCLLFCMAGIFGNSKRNYTEGGAGREAKPESERETKGKPIMEYSANEELLSLEHVISKDMDLEMADCKSMPGQAEHRWDMPHDITGSSLMPENDSYGNTVFFDESSMEECKLYAVDKKNKKHIELTQFPCTVGKMAGCVDYVLADDSVSRIHARFDKEGEKILLTDMNSTNGTYKNGLRMQPRETVQIEPGDEVRFGNLNYCYR